MFKKIKEIFGFTSRFDVDKLRTQLMRDEGVVYKIYLDHLGLATFGIGHLITKDDFEYGLPVGTSVSPRRVEEMFDIDIEWVLTDCRRCFKYWDFYPEEAKQVFANMMFNMGLTRLSKFKKMIVCANNSDWKGAAIEGTDSNWYVQVTKRSERLMRRLEKIDE